MNIDEIKELLDLFNSSGVGELELEQDGDCGFASARPGETPEYTVSPSSGAPAPGTGGFACRTAPQPQPDCVRRAPARMLLPMPAQSW